MAGELWAVGFQIGKEATPGTPVAATRILYATDPVLNDPRTATPHTYATRTRDNVRSVTLGSSVAEGSFTQQMSADECIETFALSVQGSVIPTTPVGAVNARQWVFKPGGSVDSATLEWFDGARAWQGIGYTGNQLTISGAANAGSTVQVNLIGSDLVPLTALTPALPQRAPIEFEGWETALYFGDFDAPATLTEVPCVLRNWNVVLGNQANRIYAAHNSKAACAVRPGELSLVSTLTFDAASDVMDDIYGQYINSEYTMARLVFGGNQEIDAGPPATHRQVMLDLPGAWSTYDRGGNADGSRTYEAQLQYVYNPTLAAGLVITCINTRDVLYQNTTTVAAMSQAA